MLVVPSPPRRTLCGVATVHVTKAFGILEMLGGGGLLLACSGRPDQCTSVSCYG